MIDVDREVGPRLAFDRGRSLGGRGAANRGCDRSRQVTTKSSSRKREIVSALAPDSTITSVLPSWVEVCSASGIGHWSYLLDQSLELKRGHGGRGFMDRLLEQP